MLRNKPKNHKRMDKITLKPQRDKKSARQWLEKIYCFQNLSFKILELGNKKMMRREFLENVIKLLLDFSNCEIIEIWLLENGICSKYI